MALVEKNRVEAHFYYDGEEHALGFIVDPELGVEINKRLFTVWLNSIIHTVADKTGMSYEAINPLTKETFNV